MANDCYNKIVGVSSLCCGCIQDTESLSGMYLSDTDEGFVPLKQVIYTSNDADTLLLTLIERATHEVIRELKKEFRNYMTSKYIEMNATIGQSDNYTDGLPSTAGWYFMAIKPKFNRGGYMRLTSARIFTMSGMFTGTIKLLKEDKTEIYSGAIADMPAQNLKLDQTYYLAYQNGASPKNFKHTQCCGYTPKHEAYVYVGSGTAATIDDIFYTDSPYAQGIELEVSFVCEGFDFICDLDFERSRFAVSFAHAVKQTARKNLIYWLLANDKITAYTQVKAEALNEIAKFLQEDIKENIIYLPTVYDYSDCYVCKSFINKGEILI